MLLRAVVKITLDLPPLGVACGNDARPCPAQLCVREQQLASEPIVLEGEEQRVACDRDELRIESLRDSHRASGR